MAAGEFTSHNLRSLIYVRIRGKSLSQGLLLSNVCLWTVSCVFQKCVAYTGNNMRKQTPAPDKKEKDVISLHVFMQQLMFLIFFSFPSLTMCF